MASDGIPGPLGPINAAIAARQRASPLHLWVGGKGAYELAWARETWLRLIEPRVVDVIYEGKSLRLGC